LDFPQCGCAWHAVVLANEVFLDFFKNLKFSLLKSFNLSVGIGTDNFLNFFVEKDPVDELNFVVDPVASFLMEVLNDFIILFLSAFMVILKQINKVSLLKMSADPILFEIVLQDSATFESIAFKLTNVRIAIFEYFFPKSIQLAVNVVPAFDHIELKCILIFWCLNNIVA
jgi:hypothetical protein